MSTFNDLFDRVKELDEKIENDDNVSNFQHTITKAESQIMKDRYKLLGIKVKINIKENDLKNLKMDHKKYENIATTQSKQNNIIGAKKAGEKLEEIASKIKSKKTEIKLDRQSQIELDINLNKNRNIVVQNQSILNRYGVKTDGIRQRILKIQDDNSSFNDLERLSKKLELETEIYSELEEDEENELELMNS